jgi:hypothetical protein
VTYPPPSHEHWYVAVQETGTKPRTVLAMGPFANHSDAVPWVTPVRIALAPHLHGRDWWASFGVARIESDSPEPGRFNGLALYLPPVVRFRLTDAT